MFDNNWVMIGCGFIMGILASYLVNDLVYGKDASHEID